MNAMILTNNSTASAVAVGGIIPLGSAVHGFGKSVVLNGNTIRLTEPGFYYVIANISASVTGTDAMTASLLVDGVPVASATETPGAAGDIVNLTIPWVVRKECCCDSRSISFSSNVAGTVNNITVEVLK